MKRHLSHPRPELKKITTKIEKARKKVRKARKVRGVDEYQSANLGEKLATRMYALIGRFS